MSGRPETQFLYFYHPDHLGSTEFVTDTDGELYEHAQYFPSGETWVREDDGADRLPWLFTSQELDAETGLYYLNARYYDPRVGVFASTDPALAGDPGAFAFSPPLRAAYAYGFNNPIRLRDTDGELPHILAGAGIGAVVGLVGYMLTTPSDDISLRGAVAATAGGAVAGAIIAAVPISVVAVATTGVAAEGIGFAGAVTTVVATGSAASVAGGITERAIAGTTGTVEEEAAAMLADASFGAATSLLGLGVARRFASAAPPRATPPAAAPAVRHSSRALARALRAEGFSRATGEEAHHIVASASRAAPARAVLARFGIGISDAVNGVFLPGRRSAPNPLGAIVHRGGGLHTHAYYDRINALLSSATTRAEAETILRNIASALRSGTMP
jgi:RHS repeat-associated protein